MPEQDDLYKPYQTPNPQPTKKVVGVPVTGDSLYQPFTPTNISPSSPQPVEGYGGGFYNVASEVATPFVKPVLSTISPVLDLLSRGQYASAKFFDSSADVSKGVWQNLKEAVEEGIDPKERLSFSDVIKKRAPKFAEESPNATAILGFLGDVAFDPLTYIGVGLVKEGIQVGGKTLTKAGIKSLKVAEELSDVTRFAEKKIAQNVNLVRVLGMTNEFPAQKSFYLQELGFTDEAARRAKQIDQVSGGKLGINKATQIAEDELTKEVKANYYQGLVGDLSTGEVRERAEQRIMRIADALPEFKSFESSGLRLTANIPFVATKDIPGSAKLFDMIGVNRLVDNISNLASYIPGKKIAGEAFNKYSGSDKVPQEFLENLTAIENKKDSLINGVLRDVSVLGKDINTERRGVVQEAMYKIDDASRTMEDQLGRGLTQAESDKIKMDGLQAAKLNPTEHAFVASLYQGYAEMGELEMRTNLLRTSLANYTHREYEVIKDSTQAGNLMRPSSTSGVNTYLGSSQARDYATIAKARAAGKVPEMDSLAIYAQRLIKHRDKMANAQFNEATRHAFGLDTSVYGKQLNSKEFAQLPRFAQNSIKTLGDSVYPVGMNETVKDFLQVVDTATGWWKKGAYAIKPSSGPKQLVGNTVLGSLVAGAKTFKAFDPRALMDASLMVASKIVPDKVLPDIVKKMVTKGFGGDAEFAERVALRNLRNSNDLNNYLSGYTKKSVLGTTWKGEELYKNMLDGGVIKGFDASGETMKIKVNNALKRNPDSIGDVAGELVKVWNWPAFAEDYSRAALYLNGIGMGYSHTEAVKLVNRGLFDYSRGLSYVEKNVFKRIIPFYTFQRFALPMVLKNVVTKPGQAITANKVVGLMDKLFKGDTLTPAEQETFGSSFVVEQPRVYTGFDKEGKAGFNIFNSLTPFDVLGLVVTKKDGGIDYNRTAEKSVLAAITPFLKVPAELLMRNSKGERGLNFFTGSTLDNAGKLTGMDADSALNTVLPQFVKDSIGWEVRPKQGGGTQAYVNMYLGHIMGSMIPGIKSYVNLGDGSKTALERSMEFILGIQKVKLDLKAQSEFNALKDRKQINDLKAKIKSAQLKGSQNEFEKSFKEYNEFIKSIELKQSLPGQDTIRGQGMNPENYTPPTGTVQPFK